MVSGLRWPNNSPISLSEELAEGVATLLRAALKLPGNGGLRPWIYHCLLGLLSVSDLRLGEAQNLEHRARSSSQAG